jgi:hypothetical protein
MLVHEHALKMNRPGYDLWIFFTNYQKFKDIDKTAATKSAIRK